MKARRLKNWLKKLWTHHSVRILVVYGVLGVLAAIGLSYVGGLPTWFLPAARAYAFFGMVIPIDVLLLFLPGAFDIPSSVREREDEFDPNPFVIDGLKQGLMWMFTIILFSTSGLPITLYILPIIVGLFLAIFDEVEKVFYKEWFWGAMIFSAISSWQTAVVFGYW